MADLEAAGVELEGAEEGCRAKLAGVRERVGPVELEAALGDQRSGVGLGRDVVLEGHGRRTQLRCRSVAGMPLNGGEHALRVGPEKLREGGEAGREAA